jgi:hypothetical protein
MNACGILVGISLEKHPLGSSRRRCEETIDMDLKWMELVQDHVQWRALFYLF